jgi:hypothetical protein
MSTGWRSSDSCGRVSSSKKLWMSELWEGTNIVELVVASDSGGRGRTGEKTGISDNTSPFVLFYLVCHFKPHNIYHPSCLIRTANKTWMLWWAALGSDSALWLDRLISAASSLVFLNSGTNVDMHNTRQRGLLDVNSWLDRQYIYVVTRFTS